MSHLADMDAELRERARFVDEILSSFTKDQRLSFEQSERKIYTIRHVVWGQMKQAKVTENARAAMTLAREKTFKWWIIALIVLVATKFYRDMGDIEFALLFIFFAGYFVWISIVYHIGNAVALLEVSNINQTVVLLEATLADFDLSQLPSLEQYMTISDESGVRSMARTDEQNYCLAEYEVNLRLAILESMGYSELSVF